MKLYFSGLLYGVSLPLLKAPAGKLHSSETKSPWMKKDNIWLYSNAVQTADKTIILITLWCSTKPSAIKTFNCLQL